MLGPNVVPFNFKVSQNHFHIPESLFHSVWNLDEVCFETFKVFENSWFSKAQTSQKKEADQKKAAQHFEASLKRIN